MSTKIKTPKAIKTKASDIFFLAVLSFALLLTEPILNAILNTRGFWWAITLRAVYMVIWAFGAKALIYFVFASRKSLTGCMLNPRGETTKLFYGSKKMCEGLQKLSEVYFDYKNLGAFAIGYDEVKTPYLYMKNPYDKEKFDVISDVESNTPLLIGCFEKTEGKGKAFTIVNQQDWSEPMDSVIKMKIEGKVTMYYDGEPTVMTANNGVYEFNIAQGDGIFVTVE